jgi:hypothetical protein
MPCTFPSVGGTGDFIEIYRGKIPAIRIGNLDGVPLTARTEYTIYTQAHNMDLGSSVGGSSITISTTEPTEPDEPDAPVNCKDREYNKHKFHLLDDMPSKSPYYQDLDAGSMANKQTIGEVKFSEISDVIIFSTAIGSLKIDGSDINSGKFWSSVFINNKEYNRKNGGWSWGSYHSVAIGDGGNNDAWGPFFVAGATKVPAGYYKVSTKIQTSAQFAKIGGLGMQTVTFPQLNSHLLTWRPSDWNVEITASASATKTDLSDWTTLGNEQNFRANQDSYVLVYC